MIYFEEFISALITRLSCVPKCVLKMPKAVLFAHFSSPKKSYRMTYAT